MIEKSESLDQLIENSSHKKINFVKRHFKKFVLGASIVALLLAGGCAHKNKQDKTKENTTTEMNIDITEENIDANIKTTEAQTTEEKITVTAG